MKACARITIMASNAFIIVVALVLLAFAVYSVTADVTEGPTSFPENWYFAIIAASVLIILVAALGIHGMKKMKRVPTCFHFCAMFIFFILVVVGFITILLFANEQAGEAEGIVGELIDEVEDYYLGWAPDNQEEWLKLQENIECCGISLEVAFTTAEESTSEFDVIHSGPICNETGDLDTLSDIIDTYENFEAAEENDASDELPNEYFCRDRVVDNFRKWTPWMGTAAGVVVLAQFIILFSVVNIFCFLSEDDGGFAVLEDSGAYTGFSNGPGGGGGNTGDGVPEPNAGKDTSFLNAPAKPQGFMDQAKTLGNRASMRMGFGPTFGANGGGGAGGGYGSTPSPPPGNMPPPGMGSSVSPSDDLPPNNSGMSQPSNNMGMFNRMSMKMGSMLGGGKRGAPPGPPAGFGGGSTGFGPPPGGDDNDASPQFGGGGGGGAGGGAGGGGFGGSKNGPALPPANSGLPQPNSGLGGGGGGGGGGGMFSRMSMNMKNMMGGGGRSPPAGPPPGISNDSGSTAPGSGGNMGGPPGPNTNTGGGPSKAKAKPKAAAAPKKGKGKPPAAGGGGKPNFLADISKGKPAKGLNKVETNDRSAPQIP